MVVRITKFLFGVFGCTAMIKSFNACNDDWSICVMFRSIFLLSTCLENRDVLMGRIINTWLLTGSVSKARKQNGNIFFLT